MPRKPGNDVRIFTVDKDNVVDALVATGRTNYRYALKHLAPLVDQLDIQRRIQNPRFYERLRRDLLKGCLMPPITLAFVRKSVKEITSPAKLQAFVRANIDKGFILDGIQRLTSLERAYKDHPENLPLDQSLFLNVVICKSTDKLLYRMITLNNGQRPMTARHQIEILSQNIFDWDGDELTLVTEKAGLRKQKLTFNRGDFVLAYMAFLSGSTNIDSQKLIQEKLDELVADRILQKDPTQSNLEFSDVVSLIGHLSNNDRVDTWFKVSNNLIGFCASAASSYESLDRIMPNQFGEFIGEFEKSISAFDVSKIKLGRARRNAVAYVVKHINAALAASTPELTEMLVDVIE